MPNTATPGWDSSGDATLGIDNAEPKRVARYRLRYLPDTDEVVLLKWRDGEDEWEAVYSEAVES